MLNNDDIITKATKMWAEGADILDIGGQSTRPGSVPVSATEEMDRVIPVIERLHQQFPEGLLSIDTYHASVAETAIKAGACMVNDISGGSFDAAMFSTAGKLQVPYVLTHIKGEPHTMQNNPEYVDIMGEVIQYFSSKIEKLREAGVNDIIIDPGFGFGKTTAHNLTLLQNLWQLEIFELPILVGLSRKKTIQNILHVDAEHALNGTSVMNTIALMKGASIVRVHDVLEARQVVHLVTSVHAGLEKKSPQTDSAMA